MQIKALLDTVSTSTLRMPWPIGYRTSDKSSKTSKAFPRTEMHAPASHLALRCVEHQCPKAFWKGWRYNPYERGGNLKASNSKGELSSF